MVRYLVRKMQSIWSHVLIVFDILSMKVFVWVLGQLFTWAVDPNGGILDSHLGRVLNWRSASAWLLASVAVPGGEVRTL